MISLERIRLVNWHYFSDCIIPVGTFCLLSGDNGSGKSTIVDAIQFVIASDLRKVRFNASASDRRGGRDLTGYIRCKLGSDSTDYLRDDAVGHVMLEFSDEEGSFSAGACVEAWKDGRTTSKFWMADKVSIDKIPVRTDKDQPMLVRQYQDALSGASSAVFYESGNAFRRDFTGRLGIWKRMSENNPYIDAFVRSIHFTPLVSVDQFVCDYILEEQMIDLSVMKQNLESYRQAEDLARATRQRIQALGELVNAGEACRSQERVIVQQHWLKRQLDVAEKKRLLEESITEEKTLSLRFDEIEHERALREEQKIALERERRETDAALSRDDAHLLYSGLSDRIAELENRAEESSKKVKRRELLLSQCASLYASVFEGSTLDKNDSNTARMQVEEERERINRNSERCASELSAARVSLNEIRDELAGLEQGIRRYPDAAVQLRQALQKDGIDAWTLADVAEVNDPAWSDAVEGWLNTLRFACIVPPDSFSRALELYDKLPRSVGGVPLPDIARMSADKTRSTAKKGSLAELVDSENPWARTYLDCVLGDVMTASLDTLRRYSKSVTKECMSWSRYTAIRIKEEVYRTAWLGKAAREKRKIQLQEEKAQLVQKIEALESGKNRLTEISRACRSISESLAEVQFLGPVLSDHARLMEDISRLRQERDAIDTSAFEDLKNRIAILQQKIADCEKSIAQLHTESGAIKTQLGIRVHEIEQGKEALTASEKAFSDYKTEHEEDASECERYVTERLKNQSPEDILTNFESSHKNAQSRLQTLYREFRDLATLYNRNYRELFRGSTEELPALRSLSTRLADTELPEYLEKIRRARLDAEAEFKDHFIARLNELIEEAKESFSEINSTLKSLTFGRDQYRFTLTEKNERRGQIEIIRKTAEIQDYENSLFEALVDPADRDAANSLFNRILDSDLQSAELRSICDYRTYFTYDIRVKDTETVDPATGNSVEYSLSRVLKEKSGGEAQTPYYVAIAASFFRFYRDQNNSTIRFVLFDEAFDRLDDERIAKVLSFYRELGLQVMISVPTEKLESIAPHMDTVNLVIRHGHYALVRDFYDRSTSEPEPEPDREPK